MKILNKRKLQQIALNYLPDFEFKDFTKLYKNYTNKKFCFLVNDTTLPSDNSLRIRKNLFKVTFCKNINTINNEIEQNKAQYDLNRQTAKVSALLSRNVSKHVFLTGKDVLPQKDFFGKSCYNQKISIFTIRSGVEKAN